MSPAQRLRALLALVGNQRNGSAARRAAFICWMALPAYLMLACALLGGWLVAGGAALGGATLIGYGALYALAVTLVWTLLGLTGLWLDATRRPDGAYTNLVLWWYAATAVATSWMLGTQHIVTGLIMMGAPLVGLMLFPVRRILPVFSLALAAVLALGLLSVAGHVPYGPVLAAGTGDNPALAAYWTLFGITCSGLYVLYESLVMMALVSAWHQREAGVRELARVDALTRVANRRHLLDMLERELLRMRRDDDSIALVMVDLDHFKQINDRHGHLSGDRALVAAAEALRRCLRSNDLIGRYGGEEFVIVLPGAGKEVACEVAERCRVAIGHIAFEVGGSLVTLGASLGVASRRAAEVRDADHLVHLADEAMYYAKQRGRNQVVSA